MIAPLPHRGYDHREDFDRFAPDRVFGHLGVRRCVRTIGGTDGKRLIAGWRSGIGDSGGDGGGDGDIATRG